MFKRRVTMKKRLFTVLLCLVIIALITGCASTKQEQPSATQTAETETKTEAKTEEPVQAAQPEATPSEPEIKLVYAEVNPMDSIVGKTAQVFKEKIEELTGGKVTLDIQHSGVFGAENDVLDSMLGGGGTIDMSRISAFSLTSYGGEKSKLLSIPYTFANRAHYWNFATSELAQEFLLSPMKTEARQGLFYGEEGFRHFLRPRI